MVHGNIADDVRALDLSPVRRAETEHLHRTRLWYPVFVEPRRPHAPLHGRVLHPPEREGVYRSRGDGEVINLRSRAPLRFPGPRRIPRSHAEQQPRHQLGVVEASLHRSAGSHPPSLPRQTRRLVFALPFRAITRPAHVVGQAERYSPPDVPRRVRRAGVTLALPVDRVERVRLERSTAADAAVREQRRRHVIPRDRRPIALDPPPTTTRHPNPGKGDPRDPRREPRHRRVRSRRRQQIPHARVPRGRVSHRAPGEDLLGPLVGARIHLHRRTGRHQAPPPRRVQHADPRVRQLQHLPFELPFEPVATVILLPILLPVLAGSSRLLRR
mmetsp:Transcript_7404/g.33436  ORF Transcript_7404/g.33436 Transcript_7404/m.33436 type:complete len:328 (+) Transcript_7404:1451-2434(+)